MIDINKVSFGYPGHGNLYSNLEFSLPQGNIYGLLGRNGSGKSTLIYLIAGLLRPRKGNILFMGDDTKKREPKTLSNIFILPEEFTLPKYNFKKYVKRYAPFYPRFSEETLKTCLSEFDMPYDMPMGELSMGNKKKAYVCFALATNVSLLLLDEPTNDLDMETIEILESALVSFKGTILLVSHDRAFLNNIATAVWGFERDGTISDIVGGYDEWLSHLKTSDTAAENVKKAEAARLREESAATSAQNAPRQPRPAKLTNKEREELAKIPEIIAAHEAEQKEIAEKLQSPEFIINNPNLIEPLQERSREIEAEDERLFERWSELDARNTK